MRVIRGTEHVPVILISIDHATDILIAHQRTETGCSCGWNILGDSFARHQTIMLYQAGR